jgi:hypothetical protein
MVFLNAYSHFEDIGLRFKLGIERYSKRCLTSEPDKARGIYLPWAKNLPWGKKMYANGAMEGNNEAKALI